MYPFWLFLIRKDFSTNAKKYLDQSNRINQNWVGPENFNTCSNRVFDHCYQSFLSEKRDWELGYIWILFQDFSILRSQILRRSTTCKRNRMEWFIYQFQFCLWQIKPALKLYIGSKYHGQHCSFVRNITYWST